MRPTRSGLVSSEWLTSRMTSLLYSIVSSKPSFTLPSIYSELPHSAQERTINAGDLPVPFFLCQDCEWNQIAIEPQISGRKHLLVHQKHRISALGEMLMPTYVLKMDDANLYVKANQMQATDTKEALSKFCHLFKWERAEKILDIGSGPGDVTSTILRSYIPEDAFLIGSDISKAMVDYANTKFKSNQIMFRQLDVENIPKESWTDESFHKIFSFYSFHWTQNQKLAVENMFNLLKPMGQLFLLFLAQGPIFELYRKLSVNPKWAPFMQDVDRYICKFDLVDDPAEEFRQLLGGLRFYNITVENQKKSFFFNSMEQMISSIMAVNPFVKRIPSNLLPFYKDDIKDHCLDLTKEKDGKIQVNYSLVVAYAIKSAV